MVDALLVLTNLFHTENMSYTFKCSQALSLLKIKREISMAITIHHISQGLGK